MQHARQHFFTSPGGAFNQNRHARLTHALGQRQQVAAGGVNINGAARGRGRCCCGRRCGGLSHHFAWGFTNGGGRGFRHIAGMQGFAPRHGRHVVRRHDRPGTATHRRHHQLHQVAVDAANHAGFFAIALQPHTQGLQIGVVGNARGQPLAGTGGGQFLPAADHTHAQAGLNQRVMLRRRQRLVRVEPESFVCIDVGLHG